MKNELEVCTEIYVVVGFTTSTAKSVAYYKSSSIDDCLEDIRRAFEKAKAEFISVRKVVSQPKRYGFPNNDSERLM